MAQITIKNFKGVNLKEGLWAEGFSTYARGIDLFGLKDNPSKISIPGVLQNALRVCAMAEAASPSAVTEAIQDFAYFDITNPYWYAIGRVSPARLYRLDSGTWSWVSAINTSGNGNNLIQYGANLYYATHTHLGQYDGTNGNANFQTLTDTISTPRPMRVFNGSLFIGQGRYVDKYDGTTYESQKLTLPSNFRIRSIEIYQGLLFISADNAQVSQVFTWDGISNTFGNPISVMGEANAPSLVVANNILWAVSNRGTTIPSTGVWTYNGAGFDPVFDLPFARDSAFAPPNGLAAYKNGILIGGEEGSSALYEDGGGMAWYVGKDISDGVYYATGLFMPTNGPTNQAIEGIIASKGIVYIGVTDSTSGTSYEIHQVDFTNKYGVAGAIWESLPIDAGATNKKAWHGVKVNFETVTSSTAVAVSYRLDDDTAWTALKSFTNGVQEDAFIPIGRTSRTIAIRIALTAITSVPTRVHSFTLEYTPTKL